MEAFITTLAVVVSTTLQYSAPLIFTSLGGTFSERSGIVNVGLEGIMVTGAFASVIFNLNVAAQFGVWTPWISLLIGGLVGVLFALPHAVATVHLRSDHIISGTVLNLIAPALCVFWVKQIFDGIGQTPYIQQSFTFVRIPFLADIPIIGKIFFDRTYLEAWLAIAVAFVCWFVLFKTRFGLRLRSVGEHPQAADTLGINVFAMRYAGVLLSGFFGGVGGAVVAQSISRNFAVTTIIGQGFIAMAAMIFGKWNPIGAMLASVFFGLSQSLSIIGEQIPVIKDIPSVYLQAAPYVITIIVLVAFIGKSEGPAANGTTYIKSK